MDASAGPAGNRVRGWAALVIMLAFIAGALAGAGAMHLRTAACRDDGHARGHRLPPPLEGVGLDDAQERQVREVLDRYHPRLQEAMRDAWPRLRPVFDEMAGEIRVFLTEDQRTRFDEDRRRMEERRFGTPMMPPDGPPPAADPADSTHEGRVP